MYGFCPSKVARDDYDTLSLYRTLTISCELKTLPYNDHLVNQPSDIIDLLSWFAPLYDEHKFSSRMSGLFGDGSKNKQGSSNGNNRRSLSSNTSPKRQRR